MIAVAKVVLLPVLDFSFNGFGIFQKHLILDHDVIHTTSMVKDILLTLFF